MIIQIAHFVLMWKPSVYISWIEVKSKITVAGIAAACWVMSGTSKHKSAESIPFGEGIFEGVE